MRPEFSTRGGVRNALQYGTPFADTTQLWQIGGRIEGVHLGPVFTSKGMPILNAQGVTGDLTDTVYSIRTDSYSPVNHGEVVNAVVEGLRNAQVNAQGFLNEHEGRMNIFLLFTDVEMSGPQGKHMMLHPKPGDDYAVGLHVYNSYNGDLSYGMQTMLWRFLCENGAIVGEIMGSFAAKHTTQVDDIVGATPDIVTALLGNVQLMEGVLQEASHTIILPEMFEDVLWGADVPVGGIRKIMDNPVAFAPEIANEGLTVLNAFNAATAYITYRDNGEAGHITAKLLRDVQSLLTADWNELAKRGKAKREKYEQSQKDAKEERQTGRKLIKIDFRPRKV